MISFSVVQSLPKDHGSLPHAYLTIDKWDDWFKYETQYHLIVFDEQGSEHSIGAVKIGEFGMVDGQRKPNIPESFTSLEDRFFSLGQDDTYYSALNDLGPVLRSSILAALHDIATDLNLFDRALSEDVTNVSLLRSVPQFTVRDQYHRIAHGGTRLTNYSFRFCSSTVHGNSDSAISLDFEVKPKSNPPTNIHVLIGRNGVGKTRLLNRMTEVLINGSGFPEKPDKSVSFYSKDSEVEFGNLVVVTFSAFDLFVPPDAKKDGSASLPYSYIGLRKQNPENTTGDITLMTVDMLINSFVDSLNICKSENLRTRWLNAIKILSTDPIFQEAEIDTLVRSQQNNDAKTADDRAARVFRNLSSGHKIVLLTITRLVETVAEKTLVLLDEPEAHLHPPLLSAFVRALSDLLINRNGVAIIATHSPVILQEVPRSCVWKIRRTGIEAIAERPELETFGENVGVLTREVFGLEVTRSGFHRMLRDSIEGENLDYDSLLEKFGGDLGAEAKAIARSLIAVRNIEDDADA